MYEIILTPNANKQIESAFNYYIKNASLKIAENFISEIEKTLNTFSINPFYQIRIKSYRGFPMKKFPYIFFISINEKNKIVKVIAVFNTNLSTEKYPK